MARKHKRKRVDPPGTGWPTYNPATVSTYSFRVTSAPSAEWLTGIIEQSDLRLQTLRSLRQNVLEARVHGKMSDVYRAIGEAREEKKRLGID